MVPRLATPARDDQSRPPLFTLEEWRAIVRTLTLSPRQAQVVGLAIQSKRNKEIATILRISERTVRTHVDESRRRTHAIDRMALSYRVFEVFRTVVERRHRHK
jgi:DNA-binding CsgD family transcriptional regulator